MDALLSLSDSQLQSLCEALRSERLSPPFTAPGIERVLPGVHALSVAASLNSLAAIGELTGKQMAFFGEGILSDRRLRMPRRDGVELVATGPEVPGLVHRETSVVMHDLFMQAEKSVLVAGYVVVDGIKIFEPLADRMAAFPDLQVRLFFNIERPRNDTSSSSELIRQFTERFRSEDWPAGVRLPQVYFDSRSLDAPKGTRPSLHAKCVVVDHRSALISSANFTEAAQKRNIELGLLASNPELALQVTSFFDRLVEEGILVRVM